MQYRDADRTFQYFTHYLIKKLISKLAAVTVQPKNTYYLIYPKSGQHTEGGKKTSHLLKLIQQNIQHIFLMRKQICLGEASQRPRFGANLADLLQPSWLNIYSKGHRFGIFRTAG